MSRINRLSLFALLGFAIVVVITSRGNGVDATPSHSVPGSS